MNNFQASIVLLFSLIGGCKTSQPGEEYYLLDPSQFNKRIINEKIFTTVDGLLKIYYLDPKAETFPKITTKLDNYEGYKWKGELIAEQLPNSSTIESERIIMYVEAINNKWVVSELRKSVRCKKGHGHTVWGVNPCK